MKLGSGAAKVAIDRCNRLWCGTYHGSAIGSNAVGALKCCMIFFGNPASDIRESRARRRTRSRSQGDLMVIVSAARPLAAFSIAAAFLALAGCNEAPKQASAPPPPAVTVAKPVQRSVVDQDEYVGRFV